MDEIDEFITGLNNQGYVTKEHVVMNKETADLAWLVTASKEGKTYAVGFCDYDNCYAVYDWAKFKKGVVWL
jgi:hypothetical protein